MLNVLIEHVVRNVDYYTSEPTGADFIMHVRAEIERAKSRQNETWFMHDQYIAILTFYLKYALSGTAIPRNIMINADEMISQASLRDTGTLLSGRPRSTRTSNSLPFRCRLLPCCLAVVAARREYDIPTSDRTNPS